MMQRLAALVVTALLLSACGGKEDVTITPPTELTEIEREVELKRVWQVDVGDQGAIKRLGLVPVVDDNRLYTASADGSVNAFDADTGDRLWQFEGDYVFSGGPGVSSGLVLTGSIDGVVVALDAETGELAWQTTLSSEILSQPVGRRDTVIVRSIDGRVHALDTNNGKRRWVYDRDVPALSLRGTGDPVVRGGQVYIGYDGGQLTALRMEDGSILWEEVLSEPEGRGDLERLVDVDGHMSVVGGELYVCNYHGRLAAVNLVNGETRWVRDFSSYQGLNVARTQLFLATDDDTVYGIDRREGNTLWTQDKLKYRELSTPAALGDNVIVGDLEGYVHVIDADSGELVGRAKPSSAAIRVRPVVDGQLVYTLDTEGELTAWRAER